MTGPPDIDLPRMRAYRLARVRAQLRRADIPLAVLISPVSLRYAVGFQDYQLFQSHIPIYYLFVPAEGPVVLHGANGCVLETVDEQRPAAAISYFNAGPGLADQARRFADEICDFLREIGADRQRVALEYVNPSAVQALLKKGIEVRDAVDLMEQARVIKGPEEIAAMRWSIAVAQLGMDRLRDALVPGVTENQLFALLSQTNVAQGGDWIDGRMLASGPRTNPWYQEASDRPIEAGELLAFDTDMVGPFGLCADISRVFLCGEGRPSDAQRMLYQRAYDELRHNMALIRPGLSFREWSEKAFRQPDEFLANRYTCLAHGVGICDEYPKIYYRQDWPERGYDGEVQPSTVLCVESYVGRVGGGEGVKLEQQVLVTDDGFEVLSDYPFEADFL